MVGMRRTTITVEADNLAAARELGINIAEVSRKAIAGAVREARHRRAVERAHRLWVELPADREWGDTARKVDKLVADEMAADSTARP